ncbi:hypothetical protein [Nocardiopsis alkaliphila]|uniref:hypothetical protein n=1 Tax=Nocardiopsis alkaliphila TaxID=225762 RepID=UPI0003470692|nr:hypothetical protein [Nocardiopsis alkaliphila]
MPTSHDDLPLRFLSPENRPAKVSLWKRAQVCARQIREATSGHRPFDTQAYCRAANRGALAMAMAGDMEESERSCRRQAQLLLTLIRSGSLPQRELPRVLQPWINIGRLRVIQGRCEEARAHFPSPEALHRAGVFDGWLDQAWGLTHEECDLILGSTEGRAFVTNTHVVETAKAHARAGRVDLLAEHVRRWHDLDEKPPHLREAAALLALRDGRTVPSFSGRNTTSLADAAIEVHATMVDPNRSGSLVERLELLTSRPGDADLVTVLRAGAEVLAGHDRVGEACRFLRSVITLCHDIEDEAELFTALMALGRLDPDSGAVDEARRIASDSGYAFVRTKTGMPPLRSVADEPRLAVLRDSEIDAVSNSLPTMETT